MKAGETKRKINALVKQFGCEITDEVNGYTRSVIIDAPAGMAFNASISTMLIMEHHQDFPQCLEEDWQDLYDRLKQGVFPISENEALLKQLTENS